MKIYIYSGGEKLVGRSGVGQAIRHQRECLRRAEIETSSRWTKDAAAVHVNTVLPDSVLAALGARLRGRKVVWYGHSTMEDFRGSFKGSDALAPLFRQWIRFCYGLGDVVLTPTDYSRQLLEGYGLKRPVYRISVGHTIARKGLPEFLDLARRIPSARFLWFGWTDPRLIPQEIVRAIENAPANVLFPGFVDRERLREAYCGADVFAFMSHEETEGIVVLEALACGIPTVVRDIPVYSGWLEAGKNVYKASNTDEFQQSVEGILSGALPDLTSAGRTTAESRSLEAVGARLREIYCRERILPPLPAPVRQRHARA